MLEIGSRALIARFPKLQRDRLPKDSDYIATIDEYERFVKANRSKLIFAEQTKEASFVVALADGKHRDMHEFSIAWPGNTNAEILAMPNPSLWLATKEQLLLLKMSHRYLRNSPHFLKTMRDIHFLREQGVELSEEAEAILKRREAETYNYPHPKLNQNKDGFFTDSVGYKYDHDTIHEAVAVMGRPAYQFAKKDQAEVQMSKRKFMKLPAEVQILMPLEEAYVLAIERSLVPYPGAKTARDAFLLALMKVCTSITSGWFREFSWEHYHQVVALYDDSYYARFLAALEAGRIKPFQQAPLKDAA